MTESFWYVYGIAPASLDVARAPEGIDERPVSLVAEGGLAAIASVVDEAYAPEAIERATADVAWVGPRAVAHDRVLTWASDRAPVAPLPMFSLFRDEASVRATLERRVLELRDALARVGRGREYALRLYRIDATLLAHLASMSERLAQLEAEAERATPGQRYLLTRKLEGERKAEARRVSQEVAREAADALAAHAVEWAADPIPRASDGDAPGTMVLNAAFLVADAALDDFRRALTALVERYGARGFHFDFTGPWPAYHFARAAREEAAT
jgi:hypothetical protein